MKIFDIPVETVAGLNETLSPYKGKVVLIVNIASKCGFTPQLDGLQKLYDDYKEDGLEIIGFPCNQFLFQSPEDNKEMVEFCQLNYGVTFDVFAKLDVKGKKQSPLYEYLVKESPVRKGKKVRWNFEKFLIDREGNIVNRYLPKTKPEDIEKDILAYLKK